MENKEFEEKIKQDIKRSGIPLQIYSSMVLNKLNWHVKQSCFYNSSRNKSQKEIDVIGEKKSMLPRFENVLIL